MRHQAEPRGEVAAAAEGASITDRGDQRGRVQHADARDGGQTASGRIVARHLGKLVVQRLDARIEGAPLIEHVVEQTLNARAYPASVRLRRQDRQRLEQAAAALRDYDPALEQDGAIWFVSEVRCPTSRSRTRCRTCTSSCASLLSATNRIVGRVAASAIASASRSSFFCALT